MTRCRAIAVQSSASWRRQRQDLLVYALLGACRPRSSQTLPPRLETICYAGLKKPLCHKAAWLGSEVFLFHLRQVLPQLSPHCLNGVQIARVRWEVPLHHTALTVNGWLEKETFIRGKSKRRGPAVESDLAPSGVRSLRQKIFLVNTPSISAE